jgi:hypothetical protein
MEKDRNELEKERNVRNKQGGEIKKKNLDKHVIEIGGRKCWGFDSGKVRKILEPLERSW